eukprot:1894156-Pleurochrysis_carterae.AAC.1
MCSQCLGNQKLRGRPWPIFSRFGTKDLRELNERTDEKSGRQSLYFASYSRAKWSPFGQLMRGYKSEMPGRKSFFQGYKMGCPASNKGSPVYPERPSLNMIPLRSSREI